MTEAIEVDRHVVEVSNPDKTLFPDAGVTKADVARYYERIGPHMLPMMRDRALTMHRFPDGISTDGFFQKNAPGHFPDWIARHRLTKENGGVDHVVANDVATLVYLADQGCITPHVTLSRVDRPHHPDRMVFDLDPPEESEDLDLLHTAVEAVRDVLEEADLTGFLMTTGSKGYHIVVPRRRSAMFDEVREEARRIGELAAGEHPDLLTIEQRKAKRGGRVFVDYLRNSYAQTTVAPYALRAIESAPVATPLSWDELTVSEPRQYTIANIFRRLGQKEDPWADI